MLNAYLIKGGVHKKSKFYDLTEPYFLKLNAGYADMLATFMKCKWLSIPILVVCIALIGFFFTILQKETAPYDDRSFVSLNITGPEGASYDYMDRFMIEMEDLIRYQKKK
jgi:multidrug efflux pump subunit AcrB